MPSEMRTRASLQRSQGQIVRTSHWVGKFTLFEISAFLALPDRAVAWEMHTFFVLLPSVQSISISSTCKQMCLISLDLNALLRGEPGDPTT